MIINSPEIKRWVTDYDIYFDNKHVLSFTIDHEKGDIIHFDPDAIRVALSAKPSRLDPKETVSAEEYVIHHNHILYHLKRDREMTELDPQHQQNWLDAFKEAGGTVQ